MNGKLSLHENSSRVNTSRKPPAPAPTRRKTQRKWAPTAKNRASTFKKTAVCKKCHAIYHKKRWSYEAALVDRISRRKTPTESVLCPGCHAQQELLVEGLVTVHAAWDAVQRDAVVRMLRREEQHINQDNPLSRIVSIDERPDGMDLTTSNGFLARHLARAVEKVVHGTSYFNQAPGEKFVWIQVECPESP